jgi:hypothetical protein
LPGHVKAFAGLVGNPLQSLARRGSRGDWRERLINGDPDNLLAAGEGQKGDCATADDESAIPFHDTILLTDFCI